MEILSMSIKKLLIVSYTFIIIGVVILGILSIVLHQFERQHSQKREQRYQSYLLADQLRQSSDDLTRLSRTYVITGDTKYEQMYWDVLAIRNGEKVRPQHYERVYWDLILNYGDKPRPDEKAISLQELMKQTGFTPEEFVKLQESQENSDVLVTTEIIAMNAIKGLYDDGNGNYVKKGGPDFEMARRIMYDEQFHRQKAAIMKPIDEFFQLLDKRTQTEVEHYENLMERVVIIIQIVVVLLAIWVVVIGFFVTNHILTQVGGEPGQIAQIADQVAAGQFNIEFESTSKTVTGIYAALQQMVINLKIINLEREEQNWLKTGQTQLSERVGGEQSIKQLAENIINFLTPYVNAQVGAFYLLEHLEDQQPRLRIIASHAYLWRKSAANSFELGEGIVGQAGFEQKPFVITQPPLDYIHIQSGLGEAVPNTILVTPFLYEKELKGVIELASFNCFSEIQLKFIDQAILSIGIAVNTAESRTQMQQLLSKSQTQAEALQVQQVELQQSNEALKNQTEELQAQQEELQAQQEELRETNEELEQRSQELEQQRAAIEAQNVQLEKAKMVVQAKAEELELASKYKSEFLANMSHELRTPLNSLLILAQLLANNKEGNLTETQMKYAATIYSSGSDLLTLINDILDLSKVEAGKLEINLEPVTLTDLIDSLEDKFRPLATQKELDFTVQLSAHLPMTIYTDSQRLRQVITNLLANAFKFTSAGQVTLTVQRPPAQVDLSRSGLPHDQAIAISVSDTGIGVPKDKQQVIFEAFQQADGTTSRRYGGTGLGLSISRQLIQLLGGEIHLDSTEGQGSTFTLYLPETIQNQTLSTQKSPLVEGEISSPSHQSHQSITQNTKAKITVTQNTKVETTISSEPLPADDRDNRQAGENILLIFEDDRRFSAILIELAHERQFKCLLAEDGKSGLQLVEQYQPQAIILDIGLPLVDGWSVMEKLKDNPDTRHIPVHFVSGSDYRKEARDMGAIGYCVKPVSTSELNDAFQQIENFLAQEMKNLLVIADELHHQQAIIELVSSKEVQLTVAATPTEAWQQLQAEPFDCIILDVSLAQDIGLQWLKQFSNKSTWHHIPVIIYAERELTPAEELTLQQCAETITIKEVHSPERLLDEVTLFLHQIAAHLSPEKQTLLRKVHDQAAILTGKKVLLVDDDMRNIFALAATLEDQGMEIIIAHNGKEALPALNQHQDIAVVLMDIMMPEMDGYEATRQIRAQSQFGKLPVIALTAKAMKGDKAKCIQAGANDYLAKPIDPHKLLSLLRVWLYQ
jgi:signal transduction histidine kinase/CheY-like chemotaxis protein/CHASE3 domain sensor protein